MTVSSAVEAVTCRDPYPYYATLVSERPLFYDGELATWVASGAEAVSAILPCDGCRVRPPAQPVPAGIAATPAGEIFGDLVRMTDGRTQQRRKRAVVAALAGAQPEQVAALAVDHTRRCLEQAATAPLAAVMLAVPVRVVASLCGLGDRDGREAVALVADFVGCIPASATTSQLAAAATAAGQLLELAAPLAHAGTAGFVGALARAADDGDAAPMLANAIGLLSQTYDATAGLIGNTLVALAADGDGLALTAAQLERFVREVARHDAPVQNTRRFAAAALAIGATEIAAGDAILVVLAAANRDPAANPDPHAFRPDRRAPALFTFGAAAHRCAAETLAVTIAAAVVGELLRAGLAPAPAPDPLTYRPSPNARIPLL